MPDPNMVQNIPAMKIPTQLPEEAEAAANPEIPAPDAPPTMQDLGSVPDSNEPTAFPTPGSAPVGKLAHAAHMRDFEDRETSNRASMLALDPNDPQYLQKLAAHQAQSGLLKSSKAEYDKQHPWGSMESSHPGVLGKIAHTASAVGQAVGTARAPALVAAIPGTELNLEQKAEAGQEQIADASKLGLETAEAQNQEATASKAPSEIDKNKATADALRNPNDKTSELDTYHALMTGLNGGPQLNPKTGKPYTNLEAYGAIKEAANVKDAKPDNAEALFIEEYKQKHPNATMDEILRAYTSATAKPEKGSTADNRSDKSYQYNQNRLDKIRLPIDQLNARFSRLNDTLNQHSPQADALIAPELMTVMAGGQGSGLRMNEAEIARIVGGRSAWEDLKAKIQHWSTDPSDARSVTPDQDRQIRALINAVGTKINAKIARTEQAQEELLGSDDPKDHRSIMARMQKDLDHIDAGVTTVRVQIPGYPPGEIDASKQAEFLKKHPNAKVL